MSPTGTAGRTAWRETGTSRNFRSAGRAPRRGAAPARTADPVRRRSAAVSRWIPAIDDRRHDRCRRHVMGERAVLHLALAARAPNLQHRLEIERPALHIGLGQMATRCICRISRAKREMTFRSERPALALAAITEAFEREEHGRREVVVDHERRYVVATRSGRAEARGRRLAHGLAPEIVGWKSRGRESRCHAATAHMDGRLGEVARSLAGSEDQRYAAVVDETIVEQMQRLADVARRMIEIGRASCR